MNRKDLTSQLSCGSKKTVPGTVRFWHGTVRLGLVRQGKASHTKLRVMPYKTLYSKRPPRNSTTKQTSQNSGDELVTDEIRHGCSVMKLSKFLAQIAASNTLLTLWILTISVITNEQA
jgi:hypothetical protein